MIVESTITCPSCGTSKAEIMPTDACQFFYECTGCGGLLRPRPGDCCVFCSYGSVACPPVQACPYRREGRPQDKTAEQVTIIAQTVERMLDHVSVGVRDIGRSRLFYDAALGPLGLVRIVDFGNGRGSDFGAAPGSLGVEFTITREPELRTPIAGAHLCFRAPDRRAVRAFHAVALAAGGSDDGPPGLRLQYHADYYGAYVRDPDGHRIEAVCHAPEAPMVITAC